MWEKTLKFLYFLTVSGTSDERMSTTKLDSQSNDDLKKEVDTLKMKIAAVNVR